MAKTALIMKSKKKPKFGSRLHPLQPLCGARTRSTRSSACAASACARWRTAGELPGVTKSELVVQPWSSTPGSRRSKSDGADESVDFRHTSTKTRTFVRAVEVDRRGGA